MCPSYAKHGSEDYFVLEVARIFSPGHQVYHVDIDIKEVIMIPGNLFIDRCSTPTRVHVNI